MDRRSFLKSSALIPAAVGGALGAGRPAFAAPSAWSDGTRWRSFEVITRVDILKPQAETAVWLPMPLAASTDYYTSGARNWTGNMTEVQVMNGPGAGGSLLFARWDTSVEAPYIEFKAGFAARDRAIDLSQPGRGVELSPAERAQYLKATELIPNGGIVKATAEKITQGRDTDVAKANAIYQWIVENCYRDAKVRGCGWGDIAAMLETGNLGGKCGDLNALFVGLARSVGIPARDLYGVRVAPSQWGYRSLSAADNVTRAQHCRAEFFADGHGWVPVDPADVRKVMLEEPPGNLSISHDKVALAREKLFGAWEMNWLPFNYGHDVRLPQSRGAALPYLMYPAAETAGSRKDSLDPDSFRYSMRSRETTA